MNTVNLDHFLSNPSVHQSSEGQLRAAQLELAALKLWSHTARQDIDRLTQQLAEEKECATKSEDDLWQIWKSLCFNDCIDTKVGFVDQQQQVMERIRDLIAAERELGDLREQLKQSQRDM